MLSNDMKERERERKQRREGIGKREGRWQINR